MERLESSGTKIMMREPVEGKYYVRRNRETNSFDEFHRVYLTPTFIIIIIICAAAVTKFSSHAWSHFEANIG